MGGVTDGLPVVSVTSRTWEARAFVSKFGTCTAEELGIAAALVFFFSSGCAGVGDGVVAVLEEDFCVVVAGAGAEVC